MTTNYLFPFLAIIGGINVASTLYKILDFIYLYFLLPSLITRYQRSISSSSQDSKAWALVTGASDGIGYGFALDLARLGFNVVLHGRNQAKLDDKITQLKRRFPSISFRTVIADAANPEGLNEGIHNMAAKMAGLPGPLTILINNAGGIPYGAEFSAFTDSSERQMDGTINLNARFPTQLTRELLPLLKHNGPALIMHIGSGSSDIAIPYVSVYGATKAYLKQLSRAMAVELAISSDPADKQIEWLGIQTGEVTGTSGRQEKSSFFIPTAEVYARNCLQRVGCGRSWVWAYWRHAVQGAVLGVMPGAVVTWFTTGMIVRLREESKGKKE